MARNYSNTIYIREGTLMKRVSKDTYEPYSFDMQVLQSYIESFLSEYPESLNLKNIIESSIKNATGCTSCVHQKTKDNNPNSKIDHDDPLYANLIQFIKDSDIYKANLEIAMKKNQKRAERKETAQKEKDKAKALDDFFVHTHLRAKTRSHLKHK